MMVNNLIENISVSDKVKEQISKIVKLNTSLTPLRLAHFLSQIAHESNNFTSLIENLNYSAERLLVVFPKYFDKISAKLNEKRPSLIANIVYANRMGNGDKSTNDGYNYRGRGYLQITGKNNYAAFGKYIGVDILNNPNLVATDYPMESAMWFFDVNKLWAICDKGANGISIKELTKRINGGYNGIEDRTAKFYKYNQLLNNL